MTGGGETDFLEMDALDPELPRARARGGAPMGSAWFGRRVSGTRTQGISELDIKARVVQENNLATISVISYNNGTKIDLEVRKTPKSGITFSFPSLSYKGGGLRPEEGILVAGLNKIIVVSAS